MTPKTTGKHVITHWSTLTHFLWFIWSCFFVCLVLSRVEVLSLDVTTTFWKGLLHSRRKSGKILEKCFKNFASRTLGRILVQFILKSQTTDWKGTRATTPVYQGSQIPVTGKCLPVICHQRRCQSQGNNQNWKVSSFLVSTLLAKSWYQCPHGWLQHHSALCTGWVAGSNQ